ncbi:MAG: DHHA1 domain-containing protein, partial [Flavobacteriales bacterium]
SKMVESFGKPAIVLTTHNGALHGSGRSTADMDLYKVLESCKEHILQFGGHKMAAGLSLSEANFNAFSQSFNDLVRQQRGAEPPALRVNYEEELTADDISLELFDLIKKLEPFGPGNDKPYFLMRGVRDSGESRAVGGDGTHLKVSIEAGPRNLGGIGFGMADKLSLLQAPTGADILVSLELNTWKNKSSVEVNIREIRKSE